MIHAVCFVPAMPVSSTSLEHSYAYGLEYLADHMISWVDHGSEWLILLCKFLFTAFYGIS